LPGFAARLKPCPFKTTAKTNATAKQISFGNDKQKSNGKSKNNSKSQDNSRSFAALRMTNFGEGRILWNLNRTSFSSLWVWKGRIARLSLLDKK
jgi:hypothetical protein